MESATSTEAGLGSWAGFLSEALTIKAAGYLNEQREEAGIYQPNPAYQQPVRTNNDGANLTGIASEQNKTYMMWGGAALLLLVVLFVIADMFKGKK